MLHDLNTIKQSRECAIKVGIHDLFKQRSMLVITIKLNSIVNAIMYSAPCTHRHTNGNHEAEQSCLQINICVCIRILINGEFSNIQTHDIQP